MRIYRVAADYGRRPATKDLVVLPNARGRLSCHETSSLAHSWQLPLATTCCRSDVTGISYRKALRQTTRLITPTCGLGARILELTRNRDLGDLNPIVKIIRILSEHIQRHFAFFLILILLTKIRRIFVDFSFLKSLYLIAEIKIRRNVDK